MIIPYFLFMDSISLLSDDDVSFLRRLQKDCFEPHQSKWRTLEACIAKYTILQAVNHAENLHEIQELAQNEYEADVLRRCEAWLCD